MNNFNQLTLAQSERLAMLAEECGEVIQVIGKVLRHGYESYHPDDGQRETNRDSLIEEIHDVFAVLWMMNRQEDLVLPEVNVWLQGRVERKLRYSHHQEESK